jgi:hypothetical protein
MLRAMWTDPYLVGARQSYCSRIDVSGGSLPLFVNTFRLKNGGETSRPPQCKTSYAGWRALLEHRQPGGVAFYINRMIEPVLSPGRFCNCSRSNAAQFHYPVAASPVRAWKVSQPMSSFPPIAHSAQGIPAFRRAPRSCSPVYGLATKERESGFGKRLRKWFVAWPLAIMTGSEG